MKKKDGISSGVQEEQDGIVMDAAASSGTGGADGADSTGEAGGAEDAGDGGTDDGKRPARYKIYDRIADNVSLSTMNVIVAVVSLLLIFFVVYGIATGNPPG